MLQVIRACITCEATTPVSLPSAGVSIAATNQQHSSGQKCSLHVPQPVCAQKQLRIMQLGLKLAQQPDLGQHLVGFMPRAMPCQPQGRLSLGLSWLQAGRAWPWLAADAVWPLQAAWASSQGGAVAPPAGPAGRPVWEAATRAMHVATREVLRSLEV